jgi:hypothetical protein
VQRVITFLILSTCVSVAAQDRLRQAEEVSPIVAAERHFESLAGSEGIKSAFLKSLAPDAIVFRPGPVNGIEFWKASKDPSSLLLSRNVTYSDIAANGMLGYTTGNWRLYERGKSEASAKFGQYVTIWEKKPTGWQATIDIGISHDKLPFSETDKPTKGEPGRDLNKRAWSPADASMRFTQLSMAPGGLAGALERYADESVRLLLDDAPPILGKKKAMAATRRYVSMRFPQKISLYQSADMAYTWNPCQFANSQEGMEQGNCLQIWKLRDKQWQIVLSIFARVPNETPPVLKSKAKNTATQ